MGNLNREEKRALISAKNSEIYIVSIWISIDFTQEFIVPTHENEIRMKNERRVKKKQVNIEFWPVLMTSIKEIKMLWRDVIESVTFLPKTPSSSYYHIKE